MTEQQEIEPNDQDSRIEDLTIEGETAEEVKAGGVCHGVTALAWARVDGVSG